MFLNLLEIDSYYYVSCGADTRHAMKEVGMVVFHLESGGSLEVSRVMHILELKVNILSISSLEDKYEVMFQDGQVLIK